MFNFNPISCGLILREKVSEKISKSISIIVVISVFCLQICCKKIILVRCGMPLYVASADISKEKQSDCNSHPWAKVRCNSSLDNRASGSDQPMVNLIA